MKKLRVFQTVKTTNAAYGGSFLSSIKRSVSGLFTKSLGTVLLFLLMIPYLITFLFGNLKEGEEKSAVLRTLNTTSEGDFFIVNETVLGSEEIPLELYVADRLVRSIDHNFEMEALKAQAVLIRSSLLLLAAESGEGIRSIHIMDEDYGTIQGTERIYEAAAQTKGVYLAYENQPVSGSFFAVSNGATRNGEELGLTEYPYLKSVSCSRDFLSKDYANSIRYDENEFDRIWDKTLPFQITEEEILKNEIISKEKGIDDINLYRDSAGYVLYLARGEKYISGEQFRDAYLLSSSSFHFIEEDTKIIITSEGVGHGLGMSQFTANEMAKEGDDYIKILNYIFSDTSMKKI